MQGWRNRRPPSLVLVDRKAAPLYKASAHALMCRAVYGLTRRSAGEVYLPCDDVC